jgi:hypothetical protein
MPPRGLTSQAIRDPSFQLRSRFFASNSSLLIGSDLQETGPGFAATVGLLIRLEDSATYPEAPEDISSLFVGPVQDLGSTVNLDGGGRNHPSIGLDRVVGRPKASAYQERHIADVRRIARTAEATAPGEGDHHAQPVGSSSPATSTVNGAVTTMPMMPSRSRVNEHRAAVFPLEFWWRWNGLLSELVARSDSN